MTVKGSSLVSKQRAMIKLLLLMNVGLVIGGKNWFTESNGGNSVEPHDATSHLKQLDVVCSKDHMTVRMSFDRPFYGVVFSSQSHHLEKCVHVGPRTGISDIAFHIRYDACGTIEDRRGQFHENTIVIQYGEDVLEAWDEAKKLRCEWLESFEKPSSKPTLAISDIDVVELNFQGDDIDCWMEVQEGKGPWSRQVAGIMPIGSPLTLVIAINDHSREFDMRVKKCSATDGSGHEVQLTDEMGCVLRPSLLTPFAKVRDFNGKATLIAYSHIFAFKFPDTLDVYVHCIVEVCRHGCLDACSGQQHQKKVRVNTLESKKQQKLEEFANSRPVPQPPVHNIPTEYHIRAEHHKDLEKHIPRPQYLPQGHHTSTVHPKSEGHHKAQTDHVVTEHKASEVIPEFNNRKRPNYLTKIPVHVLHSLKKTTPQTGHPSYARNASIFADIYNQNLLKVDTDYRKLADESLLSNRKPSLSTVVADLESETGSKSQVNELNSGSNKVRTEDSISYGHSDVEVVPIGKYHKIIGHDAFWNPEDVKLKEKQHLKYHIPPLKEGSYVPPQPEPSVWSTDDVRPLSKNKVFHPYIKSNDAAKHSSIEKHELLKFLNTPKPEPSPANKNHFAQSSEPKPEPAAWTFDDVNPLHKPGTSKIQLQGQRFEEPKPEPAAWSLDSVKPLTKQDLKTQSLNFKLKSHSIPSDSLPLYKEHVQPYGTKPPTTFPSPVYIPKAAQNMSNKGMMMMNMMMPTLVPATYQTARYGDRKHHPYPIPQFTHKQNHLGVVADRRTDADHSTDPFPGIDPRSFSNHKDAAQQSEMSNSDNRNVDESAASPVRAAGNSAGSGVIETQRRPITGFVPPSLDIDEFDQQPEDKATSAHTPRALQRRKRSSEPIFAVKQRFQALALTDLAFEYNFTRDSTAVLRGRREEVVYGVCMSPIGLSAGVGFILILTLCSLMTSLVLYEHTWRLRNKTSHLSFLTKTFNGRLENFYLFSRPNTSARDIG